MVLAARMDVERLERALRDAGIACSGPAAHGLLTGSLVADASLGGAQLERVLGEPEPGHGEGLQRLHPLLESLRLEVLRALNDIDLGFEPLLPDDRIDIDARARALGAWVDGFLGGLGQSQRAGALKPSPEATEILRDFAEIARIEEDPSADEANEQALAELSEYVRVGVMLLADELAPETPRSPIPLQ
jgi:uncharacterized protein YgfB (UPF0149 family)